MEEKVETLDYYVKKALDFLEKTGDRTLKLPESSHTLVVGSQTGLLTGRIAYRFSGRAFSHAQEVLAQHEINTKRDIIDDVTIFSATGSRNVLPIAEYAMDRDLPVNAVVCKAGSDLNKEFKNHEDYNEILVEIPPEQEEPPTVNTVTYGSMIQAATHEDIPLIRKALKSLDEPEGGYSQFKAFTVILPDAMPEVAEMVDWKLRGEKIGRCIGATGVYLTNFMHGAGVTDAKKEKELYVALGLNSDERDVFEQVLKRADDDGRTHYIDVPDGLGPLGYMMLGYSVVGQIQKDYSDFQNNAWDYKERASKWRWLASIKSDKADSMSSNG